MTVRYRCSPTVTVDASALAYIKGMPNRRVSIEQNLFPVKITPYSMNTGEGHGTTYAELCYVYCTRSSDLFISYVKKVSCY